MISPFGHIYHRSLGEDLSTLQAAEYEYLNAYVEAHMTVPMSVDLASHPVERTTGPDGNVSQVPILVPPVSMVDPGDIEVEAFPAPESDYAWHLWRRSHADGAHSEHSSLEAWADAVDRLCAQARIAGLDVPWDDDDIPF